MNDSKPWYASSAVWGGILAAVVPLAALLLHINVNDIDTQTLAAALAAIGGGIGGVIAIVGRIRATKQINKPS